jgi:hypothetical protein
VGRKPGGWSKNSEGGYIRGTALIGWAGWVRDSYAKQGGSEIVTLNRVGGRNLNKEVVFSGWMIIVI